MMADKITKSDFIKRVKTKYPVYSDIPDDQLFEKIVTKYPQYKDTISDLDDSAKPRSGFQDMATIIKKGGDEKKKEEAKNRLWEDTKKGLGYTAEAAPFIVTPELAGLHSLIPRAIFSGGVNAASQGLAGALEGKNGIKYLNRMAILSAINSITGNPLFAGAVNALSQGPEKSDKKIEKDILKRMALAGATGGAAQGAFDTGAKVLSKFKEPIAEAGSFIQSLLTSVPEEQSKRAIQATLEGKNIFQNSAKEDMKMATNLVDTIKKQANMYRRGVGASVGEQEAALRNAGDTVVKFDPSKLNSELKDMMTRAKTSSGESRINSKDLNLIQRYTARLNQSGLGIDDADRIKDEINTYLATQQNATNRLSKGESVLKQMGQFIDEEILSKAPELFEANKKTSSAIRTSDFINKNLSNRNTAAKNLVSAVKNDRPLLEDIETMARGSEAGTQSLDELKDLVTRDYFRKIAPGQGGGSGSSEGAMNIFRNATIPRIGSALLGAESLSTGSPAHLLAGAIFSPIIHRQAMKGVGSLIRNRSLGTPLVSTISEKLIHESEPSQNPDGSTSEGYLSYLRRRKPQ